MQELSPTPPPHGTPSWWAVVPWVIAVVGPLIGWFGAQFSSLAQLTKTMLDASQSMVKRAQSLHTSDAVRISDQESEIVRLRGELRSAQQWRSSIESWAMREHVTLPAPGAKEVNVKDYVEPESEAKSKTRWQTGMFR